jgi:Tol biopolymer transport system component
MSGRSEIWLKELETGALKQITTDGGNNCPTISPDGKRIAWIRDGEALCVYDRRRAVATRFESPKKVYFAPAWSPDGNFIAVTGLDWGKTDIYVVTADGGKAALLTKSTLGVGVPTWSSDGLALAAITLQDEKMGIAILTGIQPYKDRLMSPMQINVFPPLALKESHMKTTP